METLSVVDLVGAIIAGNLCTAAIIHVFRRAHHDWNSIGVADALALVVPLLALTAVFY